MTKRLCKLSNELDNYMLLTQSIAKRALNGPAISLIFEHQPLAISLFIGEHTSFISSSAQLLKIQYKNIIKI